MRDTGTVILVLGALALTGWIVLWLHLANASTPTPAIDLVRLTAAIQTAAARFPTPTLIQQ